MNDRDLPGTRPEDLDVGEREALEALLREEATAREHREILALGDRIAALPGIGEGAGPEAILTRVRRRERDRLVAWVGGSLGLAAVAAIALVLGLPREGVRDRGADADLVVHLEAAADGPDGLRPLAGGAVVHPGERVIFRARTSGPGWLLISEIGPAGSEAPVFPTDGHPVAVQAGTAIPGGDQPLSWRPDDGTGPRTYAVRLCPSASIGRECASDVLSLSWEP